MQFNSGLNANFGQSIGEKIAINGLW